MINHCSIVALMALVATMSLTQSVNAQVKSPEMPQSTAVISAAPDKPPALTRELIDLIQAHKLLELRTIYNGPFASALFFNPDNLEYYVALLKHNEFWWISKTADSRDAEALYSKMATQTIQLAAPTLDKLQLEARIAVTQRKLQQAQQKQSELAEQLNMQSQIVREGVLTQSQLQTQAQQLAEERAKLQQQLSAINASIQGLQSAVSRGPDIQVTFSHPEDGQSSALQRNSAVHKTGSVSSEKLNSRHKPARP